MGTRYLMITRHWEHIT